MEHEDRRALDNRSEITLDLTLVELRPVEIRYRYQAAEFCHEAPPALFVRIGHDHGPDPTAPDVSFPAKSAPPGVDRLLRSEWRPWGFRCGAHLAAFRNRD